MGVIDWSLLVFGFTIGVLAARLWRRPEPEPDERWEFLTLHAAGETYEYPFDEARAEQLTANALTIADLERDRLEWADSVVRDGSDLWKALCRDRTRTKAVADALAEHEKKVMSYG